MSHTTPARRPLRRKDAQQATREKRSPMECAAKLLRHCACRYAARCDMPAGRGQGWTPDSSSQGFTEHTIPPEACGERTLRGEVAELAVQQAAVAVAHGALRRRQEVAVLHQPGRQRLRRRDVVHLPQVAGLRGVASGVTTVTPKNQKLRKAAKSGCPLDGHKGENAGAPATGRARWWGSGTRPRAWPRPRQTAPPPSLRQ